MFAQSYKNHQNYFDVTTKSKNEVVALLCQKIALNINFAISSIKNNQNSKKQEFINKSIKIIEEGLLCNLNKKIDFSKHLEDLYVATILVLTESNLKNNIKDLQKIADIYNEFYITWKDLKV